MVGVVEPVGASVGSSVTPALGDEPLVGGPAGPVGPSALQPAMSAATATAATSGGRGRGTRPGYGVTDRAQPIRTHTWREGTASVVFAASL